MCGIFSFPSLLFYLYILVIILKTCKEYTMQNKKILFKSVLLMLLFFMYQTSIIHSKTHFLENEEECHVCITAKNINSTQPQVPIIMFTELVDAKVEEVKKRNPSQKRYSASLKLLIQNIDFNGWKTFQVKPSPLAYYATAPPIIFS